MSERERRGEGDKKKEKETGREEGGWVEGDKKEERETHREGENTNAFMISGPKPSMHQSYGLVPRFPLET